MIVIVMGIAGAGKSTIGGLLAQRLGWPFCDADELHPKTNIQKMKQGVPLNDEDRGPWLRRVRDQIDVWVANDQPGVIACSALRRRYRKVLSQGVPALRFVHLQVDASDAKLRLHQREHPFADERLLASQLETLEPPRHAWVVDACAAPHAIVEQLTSKLARSD